MTTFSYQNRSIAVPSSTVADITVGDGRVTQPTSVFVAYRVWDVNTSTISNITTLRAPTVIVGSLTSTNGTVSLRSAW